MVGSPIHTNLQIVEVPYMLVEDPIHATLEVAEVPSTPLWR